MRRRTGRDSIILRLCDADHDTQTQIADAAIEALQQEETKYSMAGDVPELRINIAKALEPEQEKCFTNALMHAAYSAINECS